MIVGSWFAIETSTRNEVNTSGTVECQTKKTGPRHLKTGAAGISGVRCDNKTARSFKKRCRASDVRWMWASASRDQEKTSGNLAPQGPEFPGCFCPAGPKQPGYFEQGIAKGRPRRRRPRILGLARYTFSLANCAAGLDPKISWGVFFLSPGAALFGSYGSPVQDPYS